MLDSLVLRTAETEGMRHLIDSYLDDRDTLAEGFSWLSDGPWSELFPHSEVWNEDRTLIAKLRTDRARIYQDLVFSDSSLLYWHE